MSRVDHIDADSRTIWDNVLQENGVMRIGSSKCNIALDVSTDIVLLDNCITIFLNKDSFSKVFINFIWIDDRKSLLFYLDTRLFIKTNHMIADDLRLIIFSWNQNTIQLITSNTYILTNDSLAEKLLVRSTNDSILCISLDPVKSNDRKGTINLYPLSILENHIATNLRLTSQTYLYSNSILQDLIVHQLNLKLLAHHMDTDRVTLYQTFDKLGVRVLDAPYKDATLTVVIDHTVLSVKRTQFTNYAYRVFVVVSFDLRISNVKVTVLLDPHCWYDGVAGFD